MNTICRRERDYCRWLYKFIGVKSIVIELLGCLQGLFLSLFFFLKSRRHLSNLFMGAYLFFFSIGLLESWIAANVPGTAGAILLSFVANAAFLYGPLLYFFVRFLIVNPPRIPGSFFIHLVPFFVFFGADILLFFLTAGSKENYTGILELVGFELFVVQILSYNIAAIVALRRHRQAILETYSSIEKKDVHWLQALLIIITGIYIFSFTLSHLRLFGVRGIGEYFALLQVLIVVSIYFMSYKVLFSPGVFNMSPYPEETQLAVARMDITSDSAEESSRKYLKSGLKPDQARKHLDELLKYVDEQKPFKNPDLNIFMLAQMVDLSRNHLTQVLNENMGVSFYVYINTCRVREAQRLMLDPGFSHLSLTGIAAEAGFKSRTTFFTNFKKITGITPQEWIKREQSQSK